MNKDRDATEGNGAMCRRLAKEYEKDVLIHQLLIKIAFMRKRNERTIPFWSFVKDATGNGSGVSAAICNSYWVDPDTGKPIPNLAGLLS